MLSGIKVVEICGLGPGPFCAMLLADLGADVIAVQRPEPPGRPQLKTPLNRGKRSVVADLKTESGCELVRALIKDADALIEGMRPGAMERLKLGPTDLHAINPGLVYGRMTGWGQSGPLSQVAGHDNNYVALSGALYYSGRADEAPISPFTALGDVGGGAMYLAVGLLAGIMKARDSGRGTVVDAAIVDGSAHMLSVLLASRNKGMVIGKRGENVHDRSHFFSTYRCKDGEYITVGALESQFYAALLDKLQLDAAQFPQWNREDWPEARERFAQIFATRTRAEWCDLLEGTDVCFAPVLSPQEAAHHPHLRARDVYIEREGGLEARPAPRFDGEIRDLGTIPGPGEHTEEIMEALRQGDGNLWKRPNSSPA